MNSATQFFDGETQEFAANYQRKASFKDRLQIFVDAVKATTPVPGEILDFGCGPGIISMELARLGYHVLGVDGSEGMVRMAGGQAEKLGLKNIRFEHSHAEGAALPPRQFDTVVCSSVVEYVVEDMALISKLVATLKPKGHLIISVPHTNSLVGKAEDTLRSLNSVARGNRGRHLSYSLRRYRKSDLCSKLNGLGLSDIRCKSFEFPWFGTFGVRLSRLSLLGAMVLIQGQRCEGGC
jgi:SAM-dependent methyltransferase